MKKRMRINLVIIFTLILSSCKTVKIQEQWAFSESKYDYEKYSEYLDDNKELTSFEINSHKQSLKSLIKTNDSIITNYNNLVLLRKFITIDSTKNEYFIFKPNGKSKNIGLFFIGNGSNVMSYESQLRTLSIKTNSDIYVLNYKGYGKSEGKPSFKEQFEINKKFSEIIKEKYDKIDFVIGYSLGSVFATYLAVDSNIRELYLLAPFSNAEEIFKHMKKQNMKGIKTLFRPFIKFTADDYLLDLSNLEKVKKYNGKLTIFHGTNDKSLPYSMGKNLYNTSISKNKIMYKIEDGNHNSPLIENNWMKLIDEINNK